MKRIDIRFSQDTVALLQTMIGVEFEKFKCYPLVYFPLVYGLVGLYIGGGVYRLENCHELQDLFDHQDDISIFRFHIADDSKIYSAGDGEEMIETPIHASIKRIRF